MNRYFALTLVLFGLWPTSAPGQGRVEKRPQMPVANAGPDVTVRPGTVAMLDGRRSSEAGGRPLQFEWSLIQAPGESREELRPSRSPQLAFVPDVRGVYVLRLTVRSGNASATDDVRVFANERPTAAVTQQQQTAGPGSTVRLDGSASSDPDGDVLTYRWRVRDPNRTLVALDAADTATPTFAVSIPGTYVASLVVRDALGRSTRARVEIDTRNAAPTVDAGPDQKVKVGQRVVLDGTGSTDPDGDRLQFRWTMASKPPGSRAQLDSVTAARPSFVADKSGNYQFSVSVSDGRRISSGDVLVTTGNVPPVADAGDDTHVLLAQQIRMNGAASTDANGDRLSYAWSVISRPAGSVAMVSSPSEPQATFVADQPGVYVAQLIVTDPSGASAVDAVILSTEALPPRAVASAPALARLGQAGVLDGAASVSQVGESLQYQWSLLSAPSRSAARLGSTSSSTATLTPDVAGSYVAQLIVTDSAGSSVPYAMTIATGTVAPVAVIVEPVGAARGVPVRLDAGASFDPDGDAISFSWSLVYAPSGSTAVLSGARTATPSIVPDLPGTYLVQSTVSDGIFQTTSTLDFAVGGRLSVSPAKLSFGQVQAGTSGSTQVISVANVGGENMVILAINASGNAFPASNTCPLELAPGHTCTIDVTFMPPVAGLATGSVEIDGTGGSSVVVLDGTAILPSLKVSPLSLDFGSLQIGTSKELLLHLENDGIGPVEVLGFRPSSPDLPITLPGITCDSTLAPHATCDVRVVLTPTTAGPVNGDLKVISDSWPGEQQHVVATVQLAGTAVAPSVKVSPLALDFGSIQVGTSKELTLHLQNDGIAPVQLLGFKPPTPDFPATVQNATCTSATLAPGASCDFRVVLAPTAIGPISGAMQLFSDAPGDERYLVATVAVAATAVAPSLKVSPLALDFGTLQIGASKELMVHLENDGIGPVKVLGFKPPSPDFPVSLPGVTCGDATLAPGASCSVRVMLTPATAGPISGEMQVFSDSWPGDRHLVATIALSGTAVLPEVQFVPASLSFEPLQIGTFSSPKVARLVNHGSGPVRVRIEDLPPNAGFTVIGPCKLSPLLSPGQSCELLVTFGPTVTNLNMAEIRATVEVTQPVSGEQVVSSTLLVTGIGLAPTLVTSPEVLDFGHVATGGTAFLETTITNTGLGPINFVIAPPPAPFSTSGGSCFSGRLGAGATCTLQVSFAPITGGAAAGAIAIMSDTATPGVFLAAGQVSVVGAGALPSFSAATSVNFDGTTSQRLVTVTNTGVTPIRVDVAIQAENFYAYFVEPGSFPMNWTAIGPGESKTLTVDFTGFYTRPPGKYAGTIGLSATSWGVVGNVNPAVNVSIVAVGVVP